MAIAFYLQRIEFSVPIIALLLYDEYDYHNAMRKFIRSYVLLGRKFREKCEYFKLFRTVKI